MQRLIEELSMSAWPALQTYLYDGWVLRSSNGYTKRANSVNPLYASGIPMDKKIEYCKLFYERLGLPAVYKITSFGNVMELDEKLENLGYAKIDETSVQVLDLGMFIMMTGLTSEVSHQLTQEWIDGYISSCRIQDENRDTLISMLKSIAGETVFVIHKDGGKGVGFGYGVIDDGYVGVFDIHVEEAFRGKGYGKAIMDKVLSEAKELGADVAYLQVVVGNTVAEKLYSALGFREKYRYWYRKL